MVAAGAVDAALNGIGEDAVVHGSGLDFFSDVEGGIEGSAGGFVADEFDAEEKAEAADFADVPMGGERSQRGAEMFGGRLDAREKIVGFEVVEDGIACGGCNGMGLIGEAVFESAGAAREGVGNFGGNENSAKRRVTAGDTLAGENQVGLNAPVLDGEEFASAAEAGHDLVGDEKKAAFAADFGDAGEITVGRDGGAESCADDWLENESSGGGRIGLCEMSLEIAGAGDAAVGKSFVERALVTKARGDMAPFGEERLIGRAARDVATDGHSAERAAVVALAPGNNTVAVGLADFEKILTHELDGSFGGFGAAGGEVDAAIVKVGRSKGEKAGGKFFGGGGMELRSMREGELRGLG